MTVYCIKSQSRRIRFLPSDLTVRHQSQLDERLEPVTNAQRQTVPFLQQTHDSFFHLFILEGSGKELGRTIRLITRRETTREHNDLCLRNGFLKHIHTLPDILCRQVLKHPGDHVSTRPLKSRRAVILTVGARKYRDKYGRSCNFMFTYIDILRFIQIGSHAALILAGRIREYLIQLPGPRLQRLLHGDLYTCVSEYGFFRDRSDHREIESRILLCLRSFCRPACRFCYGSRIRFHRRRHCRQLFHSRRRHLRQNLTKTVVKK